MVWAHLSLWGKDHCKVILGDYLIVRRSISILMNVVSSRMTMPLIHMVPWLTERLDENNANHEQEKADKAIPLKY